MNCSHCRELLAIFVEGLLGEPEKGAITSHLKSCRACRAELKEVIALHNRLVKNGEALKQTNLENNVMNVCFQYRLIAKFLQRDFTQ
ncbi:MAG: zf-HC2 domain-containing protein [Planctomycetota bacterium]|jgi:anti-sigma factor RsiW